MGPYKRGGGPTPQGPPQTARESGEEKWLSRQAHNLKIVGSIPTSAPSHPYRLSIGCNVFELFHIGCIVPPSLPPYMILSMRKKFSVARLFLNKI